MKKYIALFITNWIFFTFTVFILSGCMVNPHRNYDYSTGLPGYTLKEYSDISKNDEYKNYFIEDLYLTANIHSTNYNYEKERRKEPYSLFFEGTCREKYKELQIKKCEYSTNLGRSGKLDTSKLVFYFSEGKTYDSNLKKEVVLYYTYCDNTGHYIPIEINKDKNEEITLFIEAILKKMDGTEICKKIAFVIKPSFSIEYLDWIWDNW